MSKPPDLRHREASTPDQLSHNPQASGPTPDTRAPQDAATLAQLLRADLLPEAWIAPLEVRQLRALLRHRVALVRLGTALRNQIHAVTADHGYDRPDASWTGGYWTGPGRRWLAELPLPAVSRQVITDNLTVIDAIAPTIGHLDREVHGRAKADPRVTVLTALPGVGECTAMMLLAEIGDISRFRNAHRLASWAGLTPTVRGSDLAVHHGHISKQGSPYVRWVPVQAAQIAKRHPEFAATYQRIAKRRGTKIATVAVARKLLTRTYHLLADTQPAAPKNNQNTMRVARARREPAHRPGGGHQARACSPQRHEPATKPRSII